MTAALAARLALPDLAALPDWAAADALNAPGGGAGVAHIDVTTADVHGLLSETREWPAIVLIERGEWPEPLAQLPAEARAQIRGVCLLLCELVDKRDTLETSKETRRMATLQGLGALGAVGLISAATQARFMAMITRQRSWAEENGWPSGVSARDVGLARGAT